MISESERKTRKTRTHKEILFEMRGGSKVAQRVFGDELPALIDEINYQVAA